MSTSATGRLPRILTVNVEAPAEDVPENVRPHLGALQKFAAVVRKEASEQQVHHEEAGDWVAVGPHHVCFAPKSQVAAMAEAYAEQCTQVRTNLSPEDCLEHADPARAALASVRGAVEAEQLELSGLLAERLGQLAVTPAGPRRDVLASEALLLSHCSDRIGTLIYQAVDAAVRLCKHAGVRPPDELPRPRAS